MVSRVPLEENIVQKTVTNDGTFAVLDDVWENGQAGILAVVSLDTVTVRGVVDVDACTFRPWLVRRVDRLFHVCTIEVDLGVLGLIEKTAREAENVPQQRTGRGDLVDIPARVDQERGIENLLPNIATGSCLANAGSRWQLASGRVGQILFQEGVVSTLVGSLAHLLVERVVQQTNSSSAPKSGKPGRCS